MAVTNSIDLDKAFRIRRAKLYALAGFYAAEALSYFQNQQLSKLNGKWWTNHTFQAASRFFSKAFRSADNDSATIGFFVAHGVEYGKFLTLSNNRKNDALTPIIDRFAPKFLKDAQALYRG